MLVSWDAMCRVKRSARQLEACACRRVWIPTMSEQCWRHMVLLAMHSSERKMLV